MRKVMIFNNNKKLINHVYFKKNQILYHLIYIIYKKQRNQIFKINLLLNFKIFK